MNKPLDLLSDAPMVWGKWRDLPQPEGHYQGYIYRLWQNKLGLVDPHNVKITFARKDEKALTAQEKMDLVKFLKFVFGKVKVRYK